MSGRSDALGNVEDLLFGDILIVFVVRALVQMFRSHRAKSWPTVKARVTTADDRPRAIGCIVVELTYKYRVNGELHIGSHTEPFFWAGSATNYVEQHRSGSELIVRVKPGAPESSVVRDRDLYFYAHGYRLES
jgi:hypothetical protein